MLFFAFQANELVQNPIPMQRMKSSDISMHRAFQLFYCEYRISEKYKRSLLKIFIIINSK